MFSGGIEVKNGVKWVTFHEIHDAPNKKYLRKLKLQLRGSILKRHLKYQGPAISAPLCFDLALL